MTTICVVIAVVTAVILIAVVSRVMKEYSMSRCKARLDYYGGQGLMTYWDMESGQASLFSQKSSDSQTITTAELAKRLKGSDITVNFLHPGMIDSGIWCNVPFPLSIGMAFLKSFFKTTVEGAQTTLMLACSEEFKGVTGKYFYDCEAMISALYTWIGHSISMNMFNRLK